jgi:hypothetical protein
MTDFDALLRQPGGFEGFSLGGEHPIGDDPSVAHAAHLPVPHLHLNAAALSSASQVRFEDDAVANGDVLRDVGVGLLEKPPEVLEEHSSLSGPLIGPVERAAKRRLDLHLGVRRFQHHRVVARFHASTIDRTISTFSCDIAYSDNPAALRASALL